MNSAIPLREYLAWLREQTTGRSGRQVPTPWGTLTEEPEPSSPGETGQLGHPETSDQSLGGRLALSADLSSPFGVAPLTLGLMGSLAGPLGTLGARAATMAMAAHNQSQINALVSARVAQPDEPTADVSIDDPNSTAATAAGIAAGKDVVDENVTADADAAAAAAADASAAAAAATSSPGDTSTGPSANYRVGGVVRDLRAGLAEPITAHEGEFVVRAAPATKYRRLLESINAGTPAGVKRALRAALDA